ncbi:hypothetical protein J6590_044727 [Homalodisca vitripennis]|nr:hypothetical protein J6590_044727 [Homalodisca vitripennis]
MFGGDSQFAAVRPAERCRPIIVTNGPSSCLTRRQPPPLTPNIGYFRYRLVCVYPSRPIKRSNVARIKRAVAQSLSSPRLLRIGWTYGSLMFRTFPDCYSRPTPRHPRRLPWTCTEHVITHFRCRRNRVRRRGREGPVINWLQAPIQPFFPLVGSELTSITGMKARRYRWTRAPGRKFVNGFLPSVGVYTALYSDKICSNNVDVYSAITVTIPIELLLSWHQPLPVYPVMYPDRSYHVTFRWRIPGGACGVAVGGAHFNLLIKERKRLNNGTSISPAVGRRPGTERAPLITKGDDRSGRSLKIPNIERRRLRKHERCQRAENLAASQATTRPICHDNWPTPLRRPHSGDCESPPKTWKLCCN